MCAAVSRHVRRLQEDPPAGISGVPTEDNILLWHAIIFGYARVSRTRAHTFTFQTARHAVRGRHIQVDTRVQRGVPEQAANGQVRVEDVSPEWYCLRA